MDAIKKNKLQGSKNEKGSWEFDVADVVRWRGEPKSKTKEPINLAPAPSPAQDELIATLKAQVAQLEGQVSTKDEQISRLQDSMRDQTKMLEHHAERENASAEQANKSLFKRLFG
jgi:uncharacterized coiled-coil protein SlyX